MGRFAEIFTGYLDIYYTLKGIYYLSFLANNWFYIIPENANLPALQAPNVEDNILRGNKNIELNLF